jgi:phenylalanyl-tRNA synthetase beta chain
MKLSRALLDKVIELPSRDLRELRHLLDDLGLEVKNIEGEGDRAVLTIETLANRGDHLSAVGVARELSARLLTAVNVPPLARELSSRKTSVPVRVGTEKCLRYALLELNVPREMALRSDIAAILGEPDPERHAIVHLLNYVQQELGQPMHAFDRDTIDGEIAVELTTGPEEIVALDGKTYPVPVGSLVIKDKQRIVAVAGVIGCANSMVTAQTTKILVESASFDPVAVRLTARAMGLSTDASHAFERGVDRELVVTALKRLAFLTDGAGGAVHDTATAHPVGFSYVEGAPIEKRRISFALGLIRAQLNLPRLTDVEVTTRLKHLGFAIDTVATEKSSSDREFVATVPSWRLWDVRNPEDMVEEFGRAHGLNKVKLDLPPLDYEQPPLNEAERLLAKVEPVLVGNGFCEVITKGMYPREIAELLARLDPSVAERHVTLKNSVDSAYSHMKMTNVVSLCQLAEQNMRRGVAAVKAYEFGRVFGLPALSGEPYEFEREVLSLVAAGRWNEHEWRKAEPLEALVFHLRGVLESLVGALGGSLMVVESKEPFFHPGYQGAVRCGRIQLGHIGVVHPVLRDGLGLGTDIVYAELWTTALTRISAVDGRVLPSDYPSVRRDVTLKVGEREFAGKVLRLVRDAKPENVTDVQIIDNFKKPEEDFRRVTFRMTFQSRERTLAHGEVDTTMAQIMEVLSAQRFEQCA